MRICEVSECALLRSHRVFANTMMMMIAEDDDDDGVDWYDDDVGRDHDYTHHSCHVEYHQHACDSSDIYMNDMSQRSQLRP